MEIQVDCSTQFDFSDGSFCHTSFSLFERQENAMHSRRQRVMFLLFEIRAPASFLKISW